MNKLRLIIGREYKAMVKSKSFIITTLLMPLLILLCGGVPALIGYLNNAGSDIENVVVVDQTGKYARDLVDNGRFHFMPVNDSTGASPRDYYTRTPGDVEAVVMIPASVDTVPQVVVYSESTVNADLKAYLGKALSASLTRERVASYNIDGLQEIINDSSVDVGVRSVKWDSNGNESESSTEIAMILGMMLSLFTYMFVLMYGAMIMNSVVEEKTNRIVEVIVSSCKPFQLMVGKIVGIGLVGLTQIAVWIVLLGTLALLLGPSLTSNMPAMAGPGSAMMAQAQPDEGMLQSLVMGVMNINFLPIITSFVLYFIGGYLLYAALFAAFGSAVDQASDAGQFTAPIICIMIIALYAGIACAENPNGPMAMACSMIPFTSPVVMMVRLPYDVPLWQVGASLALLYATAIFIVWIASRIYRTGILLYGKKHSFKDIVKWIKG